MMDATALECLTQEMSPGGAAIREPMKGALR